MVGTGDLWNYGIFLQCFTDDSGILSVFYIGAMGAGDVKLLGVCAGYFPVKKFSVFYFSRCYSQQFLHFAKCTWHVICGTDCVIWVNMCGMLSAVDAGKRILQRREHIREAESVWPVPCFAVCCYT